VSSAPIPANEAARLAALARLGILDTPNEPEFDQIVVEAAAMANTPMSLISFVTESRQWFKASTGVEAKETNRSAAFCAWAIYNADVLCVEDAVTDERFHDNALVTGNPNIRAYAGVPIESPDGFLLGTLCVIDDKPKAFDQAVVDQLKTLAARVSQLLIGWKPNEQSALGGGP
jgi:GAF domain-containing protein